MSAPGTLEKDAPKIKKIKGVWGGLEIEGSQEQGGQPVRAIGADRLMHAG